MGRNRTFDETQAVADATRVFAVHGYAGTSVDRLVTETGVNRGSLYGIFGSKRGLFLACLEGVDAADGPAPEVVDLLLVALLDLAPTDEVVRARVESVAGTLWHGAATHTIAARLGEALLARGRLVPRRTP